MDNFISAIPEAAKSPFALFAYALAIIAAIFGGSGLRELRLIMRRYAAGQHTDAAFNQAVQVVTQKPIPPKFATAEEFIRHRRLYYSFVISLGVVIVLGTLGAIALTMNRPGRVYVDCKAESDVFVDDKRLGRSALWATLPSGPHIIECQVRGETIFRTQIDIQPGGIVETGRQRAPQQRSPGGTAAPSLPDALQTESEQQPLLQSPIPSRFPKPRVPRGGSDDPGRSSRSVEAEFGRSNTLSSAAVAYQDRVAPLNRGCSGRAEWQFDSTGTYRISLTYDHFGIRMRNSLMVQGYDHAYLCIGRQPPDATVCSAVGSVYDRSEFQWDIDIKQQSTHLWLLLKWYDSIWVAVAACDSELSTSKGGAIVLFVLQVDALMFSVRKAPLNVAGGLASAGPTSPPPPPREERIVARPGLVWIRGSWRWSNSQWYWTPGHWEREREGYIWRDEQWEPRDGVYVRIVGDWIRVSADKH